MGQVSQNQKVKLTRKEFKDKSVKALEQFIILYKASQNMTSEQENSLISIGQVLIHEIELELFKGDKQ